MSCPLCRAAAGGPCPVCRSVAPLRAGPPTPRAPEPETALASFVCACPTATGWPGDEVLHLPVCRSHPLFAGPPVDRPVRRFSRTDWALPPTLHRIEPVEFIAGRPSYAAISYEAGGNRTAYAPEGTWTPVALDLAAVDWLAATGAAYRAEHWGRAVPVVEDNRKAPGA